MSVLIQKENRWSVTLPQVKQRTGMIIFSTTAESLKNRKGGRTEESTPAQRGEEPEEGRREIEVVRRVGRR